MTLLRVEGLSVSFGGLRALNGIDMLVEPGEMAGVLGPNGAGKTTFFNVLSRFVQPSSVSALEFMGVDLRKQRPHQLFRLGMARTFQTPVLIEQESVRSNVLLGARLRAARNTGLLPSFRRTKAAFVTEAETLMHQFGILEWAGVGVARVPYQVRKLAQICQALMGDPKLLLLDEPASGLTPEEKADLASSLSSVVGGRGCSLLAVEHDVDFLTKFCKRLIVLNFGQLIADDEVDVVKRDQRVIDAYLGTNE